jgi:hypothetical protein
MHQIAISSESIHGYPFIGGLGSSPKLQSSRITAKIDPQARPRTQISRKMAHATGTRKTVLEISAKARTPALSMMSAMTSYINMPSLDDLFKLYDF